MPPVGDTGHGARSAPGSCSAGARLVHAVDRTTEPPDRRPDVTLDLVQVDQEVLALRAVDLLACLVDPVEHLVEGGQHRGQIRMHAHPVCLAPADGSTHRASVVLVRPGLVPVGTFGGC